MIEACPLIVMLPGAPLYDNNIFSFCVGVKPGRANKRAIFPHSTCPFLCIPRHQGHTRHNFPQQQLLSPTLSCCRRAYLASVVPPPNALPKKAE